MPSKPNSSYNSEKDLIEEGRNYTNTIYTLIVVILIGTAVAMAGVFLEIW